MSKKTGVLMMSIIAGASRRRALATGTRTFFFAAHTRRLRLRSPYFLQHQGLIVYSCTLDQMIAITALEAVTGVVLQKTPYLIRVYRQQQ
jgi:hypothetical protein